MEKKTEEILTENAELLKIWSDLVNTIECNYEMEKIWDNGYKDWVTELKYRRGGKTLCTLYAKENEAVILIVYGKKEREKFENCKEKFPDIIIDIYENSPTYHDGKWIWIGLDNEIKVDEILEMLKIKRKANKK